MKTTIISAFFLVLSCQVFGQPRSTYLALNEFLNTDFFREYDQIRERAEKAVRTFKAIQGNYSEEEIQNVKDAYDASANYFNSVLGNIKNDLLHKDKRKYIIKYPSSYSKQIEADLYRAKDYYENTFRKEINRVTDGQIIALDVTTMLPLLIRYAKKAILIIRKIKKEMKKYNEAILQKHLIEPYRFKNWDEII